MTTTYHTRQGEPLSLPFFSASELKKQLLNNLSQDQQKQQKVLFLQQDIGKLVVVKPTRC